jgi:hypothetical protein
LDLELDPGLDDLFWFSDAFTSEESDFSGSETDEETDETEDAEIQEDVELLVFMETLQRAKQEAVECERQWQKGKKYTQYTGNSNQTLQRHKATQQKIAQGGSQPFISALFQWKASFAGVPDSNLVAEEQDNASVDVEAELV